MELMIDCLHKKSFYYVDLQLPSCEICSFETLEYYQWFYESY